MGLLRPPTDRIQAGYRCLQEEWDRTREVWRDPVADKFERQHYQQWEEKIPEMLRVMAALDEELERVSARVWHE